MIKIFQASAVIVMIFFASINNVAYGKIGGYSVNLENNKWETLVDTQVQITSDLVNHQVREQPFAYLVQIQDENKVTLSLSWITGSLAPGQSMNPSQSWTPKNIGKYTAEIFVWESVENPDPLSQPLMVEINVVTGKST